MSFAAPLAFALAALAAPILVPYILKVKRRRVAVPYLRLWEELLIEVLCAKNRLMLHHGFSPQQHVFGRSPRLPCDLLDEQSCRISEALGGVADGFNRSQEIRCAARAAMLDRLIREGPVNIHQITLADALLWVSQSHPELRGLCAATNRALRGPRAYSSPTVSGLCQG